MGRGLRRMKQRKETKSLDFDGGCEADEAKKTTNFAENNDDVAGGSSSSSDREGVRKKLGEKGKKDKEDVKEKEMLEGDLMDKKDDVQDENRGRKRKMFPKDDGESEADEGKTVIKFAEKNDDVAGSSSSAQEGGRKSKVDKEDVKKKKNKILEGNLLDKKDEKGGESGVDRKRKKLKSDEGEIEVPVSTTDSSQNGVQKLYSLRARKDNTQEGMLLPKVIKRNSDSPFIKVT